MTWVVARFTPFLKPAHDMLLVDIEVPVSRKSVVEVDGAFEPNGAGGYNLQEQEKAVDGGGDAEANYLLVLAGHGPPPIVHLSVLLPKAFFKPGSVCIHDWWFGGEG
jgi:hypothetical protein